MVFLFIAGLVISIVGLVTLLYVKHWELSTGRLVAVKARPHVNRASKNTFMFFEHVVPALVRVYGRRGWRIVLASIHRTSAWVVLRAEHFLEYTLHSLRHSTDVRHGAGEASAFLRQVAEHKKKLQREQQSNPDLHKE